MPLGVRTVADCLLLLQSRSKGRLLADAAVDALTQEIGVAAVPCVLRDVNDQLDAEYRDKYRCYPDSIVNSVLTPAARSSHDRSGASFNTPIAASMRPRCEPS